MGRSKCHGYINFTNIDDARSAAAAMHGRYIDGSQIKCTYLEASNKANNAADMGSDGAKPNMSILVGNLSPDTDEDALIAAFARCGVKGVSSATLVWEAPSEQECKEAVQGDQVIAVVLGMLSALTEGEANGASEIKAVSLFPEKSSSKKRGGKVRVTFNSSESVQRAMELFDGKPASQYNLSKHGKIRVRQDLGYKFFIPLRIAAALREDIQAAVRDICGHGFVIASAIEKPDKGTTVWLKGYHEGYMLRARQILSKLVTPEYFSVGDDGDEMRTLFSPSFLSRIDEINDSKLQAHIHCDKRINRISIYGAEQARKEVRNLLTEHAHKIQAEQQVVVDLKPGEIKVLVGQHGVGDEEIRKHSGCSRVDLDIRKQKVTCTGSQEAIKAAEKRIQEVLAQARASTSAAADSVKVVVGSCPVCFCDIEGKDASVKLEACGHVYHRECMGWLLANYAKLSGPPLPVTCAYAHPSGTSSCKSPLWVRDLQTLCTPETLHKMHRRAYRQYVELHLASLLPCPTPDCPQVVPRDRRSAWTCDCCTKSYCVQCTVALGAAAEAHPGVLCEQYRELANQPQNDKLFQEYLAGELGSGAVKPCPKCKLPQAKDDKCNHVECAGCGKHWCFRCGVFWADNGLAIYGHFTPKPGGCIMYKE
jgi:hypothetical protein